MNFVSKENHTNELSKDNKPVLTVKSNDTIIFETYDCLCNQIKSKNDDINIINFSKVNPATGPVYIENAKPNQVLKVFIKSIELQGNAIVTTGPNLGVLGHKLDEKIFNILPISNNQIKFKNMDFVLNKMIGVIGVAPKYEAISCGTPGAHGGNMDCKIISEGSTLYLPIFNEGALLSMGDVHALMGDGEIGISGAEIGAKIEVQVEVIEDCTLQNPIIETKEAYYTIASHDTLDGAYKIAVEDMFDKLLPTCSLSKDEIVMLLSMVANLEICQVVDPLKTVRFKIDKDTISKLNINKFI